LISCKAAGIVSWSLLSIIAVVAAILLFNLCMSETIAVNEEPSTQEMELPAAAEPSETVTAESSYSVGIQVKCNVIVE
jgi:hypothetical protein